MHLKLFLILLIVIPVGLFAKKKPFIGKDRFNRQISEGIENNGDTISVTYYAFYPFQIDTTNKMTGEIIEKIHTIINERSGNDEVDWLSEIKQNNDLQKFFDY